MTASDPILAAIEAVDMASLTHTATLVHRDEDDEASEAVVEAAGRAVDKAFEAVQALMPTTLVSLHALAVFYARDAKLYDRTGNGAGYLEHIASALALMIAREGQSPLSLGDPAPSPAPCGASRVPNLQDVTAAWSGLSSHVRNQIGIAVVDMTFQEFVSGEAYIATGQFEDLPVYDPDTRAAAAEAANRRLNELPKIVEAALPDLFGKDENPAWSENPGTVPTPAARAWAARERTERAARQSRLEAELDAEDAAIARADQVERAVRFALAIDDNYDARDFLKGWLDGDTGEWPEFAEGATRPQDEPEADDAAA